MALISLRVSDEVAAQFSALAATQGGKSALLRRFIADALAAPEPRILALPVGRPEKVTVRFRCQTACKIDPRSASKIDPPGAGVGSRPAA